MGMRQRLGVAACLLGDPDLLILDEPMNGLDPAGMQDMREMISSLVAEGRTVMLSSHLLDEVERTCDAVAIVDRGRIVRQGPISELLAGSSLELEIGCSDPDRARTLLQAAAIGADAGNTDPHRQGRAAHHPASRYQRRRGRRDQPGARRGRDLGAPARPTPGVTRILVPPGHQPAGRTDMTAPCEAVDPGADQGLEPGTKDHRGSWIPSWAMIATRFMELRRRRGLMLTIILVTVGIPVGFMAIRLLLHAVAPKTYGPAGGYAIYGALVAGVLYTFGFIVAAALGVTAGSADLTDGMFRHLVITGRSRLALYLARIPAGLAIIVPAVAAGFTVVCLVCVFAAPNHFTFNGVTVPADLSRAELQTWASEHPTEVICNFGIEINSPSSSLGQRLNQVLNTVPCPQVSDGPGPVKQAPGFQGQPPATPAQIRQAAIEIADNNYPAYSRQFLSPSTSLMIRSGLWLELEATIGFVVGLGLGSLTGVRTPAVIAMIVLEVVLTPIFSRARIPHFINVQRAVVGLATAHLAPGGLNVLGGGGGGPGGNGVSELLPETRTVAIIVIIAWLVAWTALGAWRMITRDA